MYNNSVRVQGDDLYSFSRNTLASDTEDKNPIFSFISVLLEILSLSLRNLLYTFIRCLSWTSVIVITLSIFITKTGSSDILIQGLILTALTPIWRIIIFSKVTGESKSKGGDEYYQVFVPTTPNPTSGFMLYLKKTDIKETNMSVDEGLKIIISGGMLAPEINEI